MANNQSYLNSVQIVFDVTAGATGSTDPIAVLMPFVGNGTQQMSAVLDVDSGGTGNLTVQLEGRCVTKGGATRSAWVDLGDITATAAGAANVTTGFDGPFDEYRVTVNTAQTGSPGNFRVWLLVGNRG